MTKGRRGKPGAYKGCQEQWFSNLSVHQNPLQIFLKNQIPGLYSTPTELESLVMRFNYLHS